LIVIDIIDVIISIVTIELYPWVAFCIYK